MWKTAWIAEHHTWNETGLVALLNRYRFAATAAAVGLAATILAVWTSISADRLMRDRIIERELLSVSDLLSETIGTSERFGAFRAILRASAGFVEVSGIPSEKDWRLFCSQFEIDGKIPGIQGLGFALAGDRATILAAAQDEVRRGQAGFRLWPDVALDLHSMILRLAPDDVQNRSALGFDMSSEPYRREAMQAAMDSGNTAFTDIVTLIQDSNGSAQPAGLAYRAVYTGGGRPATAAERRKKLIGFVYAAFRWGDYITDILTRSLPHGQDNIHLRVSTPNVEGQDILLYQTPGADFAASTEKNDLKTVFTVGQQQWTIEAIPTQQWNRAFDWNKPFLIFLSGLALTGLTVSVTAGLAYSRDVAFREQERLAKEVKQRREAQEQVQLANSELIHRVKNTLAIVSAIASQTARNSTTLPGFVSAFRDRLAALSTVHDLLRPDPSFTPNLETFLHDMLKAFAGEVNANQLVLEGPTIMLPRNEAVLLSLLINELATNATKYGSWSTPLGKVCVTWRLEESETGDHIVLTWSEIGGPRYEDSTSVSGFGTKVIEAIERGLRGQIERTFPNGGLNLEFRFPRPRTVLISHG